MHNALHGRILHMPPQACVITMSLLVLVDVDCARKHYKLLVNIFQEK